MLGHPEPRPGGHEGHRCGDIERARGIAAGAAGIDNVRPFGLNALGVGPHHAGAPGDLGGGLAFHTERGQERPDLRGSSLPAHDLGHHPFGLGDGQVLPFNEFSDGFFDHFGFLYYSKVLGLRR